MAAKEGNTNAKKAWGVGMDSNTQIRHRSADKRAWQKAAKQLGIPLSKWIRTVLNNACKRRGGG